MACTPGLRLNDLQTIGSHNSYKQYLPEAELDQLALFAPDVAAALDYGHLPLTAQLDLGVRQLELDIYYDPEGGRYADPILPRMMGGEGLDTAAFNQPGFKVMHVQDVDVRSSCTLFRDCLSEIEDWSRAHSDHAPILILINAKQDEIELPGSVVPLAFDAEAFEALDAEVRGVLAADRLITPDAVRGQAESLRESVLAGGWPDMAAAKGKILIALDEAPDVVRTYMRDRNSLEGLPLFVNSIDAEANHAAYFTRNDPVAGFDEIRQLVQAGYIVRTRADADTAEARSNDTTRRDAAFASGAQYISTDFYQARPQLSEYRVALPGDETARCNRLRQKNACNICVN